MCRWLYSLFIILTVSSSYAQSPDRISYQAVVRNASGNLVSNQSVGMRVTLLKGSATGTPVYTETHTKTTNANGLLSLEIGGGAIVSGSFASLPWGQGPYFIKTETDVAGGTNYQLASTSQLLSVPFALFSKSSSLKYSTAGDTLYSGTEYVIVPGLSAANQSTQGVGQATVTTSPATNIGATIVVVSGQVVNQGTSTVNTRGICYGLTGSPTTSNFTATSGSGTGSFQVDLMGLTSGTLYYARAFAINGSGTSYGNQVLFTTAGANPGTCTGTLKDIDGNEYGVVAIGNQCWMKENLRVTKFRNGAAIPIDSSGGISGDGPNQTWAWLSTPARSIYNHDTANIRIYGYLYIRSASMDSRGICPVGWHLPSASEWTTSAFYLGGELVSGGKMKSTGISIWKSPNEGADNSSNFSALPGGKRDNYTGKFSNKGEIAFFWASGDSNDRARELHFDSRVLRTPTTGYSYHEFLGHSIRYIRD